MLYNVIHASEEQISAFYEKHMVPSKKIRHETVYYYYDSEDKIGFFSISTTTGKKISCQIRGNSPCFIELTGFGGVRYDINNLSKYNKNKSCQDFYKMLREMCLKAKEDYWKAAQI